MKVKCEYPVFEKIMENGQKSKVIEHVAGCFSCQKKLLLWEFVLPILSLQKEFSTNEDLSYLEIEEIFSFVEDYRKRKAKVFQEKSGTWQKIVGNPKLLEFFQKIFRAYTLLSLPASVKFPKELKTYIDEWFKAGQTKPKKIFIVMGETLKLLGGFWENAQVIPAYGMSLRHPFNQENMNQVLKFKLPYSENLTEDQGEVLYQVMRDGKDNLLLTVGIENCHPKPQVVSLKREGRLLHSYPVRENWLYFPQLTFGTYEMEFKDREGQLQRKLEFALIQVEP